DMRAVHAALHGFQGTADLRQHAAGHGAVGYQVADLSCDQPGQDLPLLVHQTGDAGQQHQLLALQRLGHLAGHQVGVDVVRFTVLADANGGDDRDEIAARQHLQQIGVDPGDFADMADVDDFRLCHFRGLATGLELFRADQIGVFAGQTDGVATMLVDQIDDAFVDLAAQHHFHHIHGLRVGHAHAVDKVAFDVQALEQVADLRAAAVHHHRVDADRLHQHDIAGEAGFQLLAFHGVAAVLDDQRLADEATDIGQRFGQDLGELGGSFTAEGHAGLRKSERQLEIRRDSIKLGAEDVLYALELGFAFRLEAQHQYRCGVGSAHQTPAFRIIDAQAVKGGD